MANNWDEFFAAPIKASKKLHVTAKDVASGAKIDARNAQRRAEALRALVEQNRTTPTGLPYGVTPRPSGVPSDAPRMYAGELTKSAPPELISNALLAGNLGGLSAAFGALAPLRAGLAVGAGADAVLGAKAGEGDTPAVLSGAGMLGRRALPVALATGAAYAADVEASGGLKKLLQGVYRGYAGERRPTIGALGSEMYFTSPQKRVADYYATRRAAETGEAPHVDMLMVDPFNTKYQSYSLGLPADKYNPSHDAVVTRARRVDPEEVVDTHQLYAGGGLVKSGLKMMFPNLGAPLHVVKPKGGNWLSGSVEDALSGLRKDIVRYDHPRFSELLPEDQSRLNADGVFGAMHDFTPEVKARISEKVAPLNNWIEGPLTKYVKTRMASPDDEVRRLADQGVLHFEPRGIRDRAPIMDQVVARRLMSGNPATEQAITPLGEQWERYADSAVQPMAVSELSAGQQGKNLWTEKLPRDATVYNIDHWRLGDGSEENLGFDHLIDELSNALDPNSGLPRHLQLTPEAVKNLSMEKAVRRVADINAWRAAQIAEANGKIAGGPGQELVREYAHSPDKPNPKGLRWVELKKQTGDKLSDEQLVKAMEERGMYPEEIETALKDPKQRAQIEEQAFSDVGALADQLRYEGDTMGHCVGGYCDDVISGRSRIFSLRDAKGEPHVTIEVAPFGAKNTADNDELYEMAEEQVLKKLGDFKHPDFKRMLEERYNELVSEPQGYRIEQIKGKQNRKPNDEYLPFVQDFVKNPPHGQPWGDVGDLQNSGLRRTIDAFNSNELKKIQEAGIEVPTHATPEEIEAINRQIWPDPDVRAGAHPEGFASGGSVGVPAAGWEALTDPTGSPEENKLSWDIFSGHNDSEQLEAVQ